MRFTHTAPTGRPAMGVTFKQGDSIGYPSNCGNATGVHIHMSMLDNGVLQNIEGTVISGWTVHGDIAYEGYLSKPGQPNVYRYGALVSDNYGTPEYTAQLVGQNVTNMTLWPEQSATFQVVIKNTGTATWSSSGQNPVRLGTDNPQNRVSPFCTNNGWLPGGCSRITMTPATVAPGENTTFSAPFQLPANYTPGSYNESFKPLVETITWLHDIFLTVAINVISTPSFVVAKEINDGSENTLSRAISQATNGQVISISPGITSIKISC